MKQFILSAILLLLVGTGFSGGFVAMEDSPGDRIEVQVDFIAPDVVATIDVQTSDQFAITQAENAVKLEVESGGLDNAYCRQMSITHVAFKQANNHTVTSPGVTNLEPWRHASKNGYLKTSYSSTWSNLYDYPLLC